MGRPIRSSRVIRDGMLYGRGAADMKSGLAAMVTAAERFVAAHPDHAGTLAFLLTSDEEGPSVDGTRGSWKCSKRAARRSTGASSASRRSTEVLGDTIKVGRRGSLSGRLTVHGVQGHVAYPQLADNPVHRFAPALAELAATRWDEGNEFFQPTTLPGLEHRRRHRRAERDPRRAEGCASTCVSRPSRRSRTLQQTRAPRSWTGTGVNYTLEWFVSGLPFLTPPGALTAAVAARRAARRSGARPSCRRPAAPPTAASSRRPARRSSSSASSTRRSTRSNEYVRVEDIDVLVGDLRARDGADAAGKPDRPGRQKLTTDRRPGAERDQRDQHPPASTARESVQSTLPHSPEPVSTLAITSVHRHDLEHVVEARAARRHRARRLRVDPDVTRRDQPMPASATSPISAP